MTSLASHHREAVSRSWAKLSSALLAGLALVVLLIWGNRVGAESAAVPPDTLAPPSLPSSVPARLARTAQISTSTCPLDAVIVLDRSGSMHYDPVCYGCWTRDPQLTENDIPDYYQYPNNGIFYPIPSTTLTSEYCILNPSGYPPVSFLHNQRRYIIIEAELYSHNNTQPQIEFRSQGKGYWALQRGGRASEGLDERGGYMAHHPERTFYPGTNPYGRFYTLADAQNGNAPLLEYRFWINLNENPGPWGGQAYVWVRARRGPDYATDQYGNLNRATFYWSLDDTSTPSFDFPTQGLTSAQYNVLDGSSDWHWIRLTQFSLSPGQSPDNLSGPYVLQLWAGSSGIWMDRIIITNNAFSPLPLAVQSHELTPGSAYGEACDPCNPIYALTVEPSDCLGFSPAVNGTTDLRTHPLWGDWEEPLRGAKEAAKRFVIRLDPEDDQVGLVTYDANSIQDSQLECRSRWGTACYEGTTPISYTRFLASVESVRSDETTCTACGMRDGLEVLGINIEDESSFNNNCDGGLNSHCARDGAKKVMILLTDGAPNRSPPGSCADDPNLWPNGGAPYDCSIYYAQKAAERGVVIFPIGLGFGVDWELLQTIAQETNGQGYITANTKHLDPVFDEIISSTISSCSPQNLILAKSATPSEGLQAGDTITYSLSFSNIGDLATTNVVLTDRLPINTQFVTATGSFTPAAPTPGDNIRWSFGQLDGGATGTQRLTLVISPTQPGDVIINVARIYGDQASGQATLTLSFAPTITDESRSIYLPIIFKVGEMWAQ